MMRWWPLDRVPMSGARGSARSEESLRDVVADARGRLRRRGAASVALSALLVVLAVLLVALLIGATAAWPIGSGLPLALDVTALIGLALLVRTLARRWVGAVDDRAVADAAERERALPDGSIKAPLELATLPSQDADGGLIERAQQMAREMIGELPVSAAMDAGVRRRLVRLSSAAGVGVVALLVMGFAAPDAAREGLRPMLRPVRHLRGLDLPPVRVRPASRIAPRGSFVDVEVQAPQRREVRLAWRASHGVPTSQQLSLDDGVALARVGPIRSATSVWAVTPDGAASDTVLILPEDPLLLTSLEVEAHYPSYLRREPERFLQPLPPLVLPAGSELRIAARATAPLSHAAVVTELEPDVGAGGELAVSDGPKPEVSDGRELAVRGDGFSGTWTPRRSGTYEWRVLDAAGRELSGAVAPLDITILPDSAPVVHISYPGVDTVMPADERLPIMADAHDDHGLLAAELISWRVGSGGVASDTVVERLPVGAGAERTVLRTIMDLSPRGLLPGDTLKYRVRAMDTAPYRGVGESRVYSVVFPDLSVLRREVTEQTQELVDLAERMSEDAESLARKARAAEREMRRGESQARAGARDQQPSGMQFGEADRLERMLAEDEQLVREAERMQERIEALQRAMHTAGLQDPSLQRQLEELRELYEEALSEALRKDLQRLEEALAELDPEQVQAALEQLAERQEAMRAQLERSLELFRRAAAEQEMNALAAEARELAAREEAVAAALADSASAQRGLAEQELLAQEADALEARLDSLADRLARMDEDAGADAAGQASQAMQSAQQSMSSAQQQAQAGQMPQSAQQAREAAGQMQQAAQQLEQSRQQMAQGWRREASEEVQQATQDVLSLAQEQEALRRRMEEGARSGKGASPQARKGMRADQGALEQGLEGMGRNLSEAGQRSAMVSREVGAALGRAMLRMSETREALTREGTPLPEEQAAEAVEALNQLAMELVANADRISRSASGTGLQEALEQLAELAREQGAINSQSGALIPLSLPGAAMANQLEELGRQQQGIAQSLEELHEEMGGNGEVLGRLDELAREAEALARQMRQGTFPPEARARQERLFHRLLDAGRSLERDEPDDERRAERPGDVDEPRAGALDPSLLRGPRYRLPSDQQLRQLSPAYRRLILEYFDRLNRESMDRPDGEGVD